MSKRIKSYVNKYGTTVINGESEEGYLIVVEVRRDPVTRKAYISWPALLNATTGNAAVVHKMLGKAIEVAKRIDAETLRAAAAADTNESEAGR